MSASFRPVKETWYQGSDQFVSHELLLQIFEHVADEISSNHSSTEYGDLTAFRVENGHDFLKYITKNEDFTAENFAHNLLEEAEEVTAEFLNVMSNMRNSAELWKQALDEDGSLRFYID
jgi:hypothetical protein